MLGHFQGQSEKVILCKVNIRKLKKKLRKLEFWKFSEFSYA